MSWKATGWAKETRGHRSMGQKFLLLVLADYAEPERNQCWPTVSTLAEDCMMSKRTIIRLLNSLEEQGFITRLQKGNQFTPSVYRVNVGWGASDKLSLAPPAGDTGDTSTPGEQVTNQEEQVTPDVGASDIRASEGDTAGNQNRHPEPTRTVNEPSVRARDAQGVKDGGTSSALKPTGAGDSPPPSPREPAVSELFRAKMRQKHGALQVDSEIDAALNHKAVLKYRNVEQYVQNWLRKAQKWADEPPRANARSPASRPQIDADPNTYSFFGDG